MKIKFKRLREDAIEPLRATDDAACFDLYALETVEFEPGEIKLVRTGWACEVPPGYRTNIYVRSSTPSKKHFILANGIGIVDGDYRGELLIQLMNVALQTVFIGDNYNGDYVKVFDSNIIKAGDKIAQLEIVSCKAQLFEPEFVKELSETNRGGGGFGSTGL